MSERRRKSSHDKYIAPTEGNRHSIPRRDIIKAIIIADICSIQTHHWPHDRLILYSTDSTTSIDAYFCSCEQATAMKLYPPKLWTRVCWQQHGRRFWVNRVAPKS